MASDRSEHEPEEYDPEAEFRDPESDSLTIPRVPTEDAGSGLRTELNEDLAADATEPAVVSNDVSPELLKAFWSIVLIVNGAVLATSIGILFVLFDGVSTHSIALLAGGIVLFGSATRRYRTYRSRIDSESSDDPDNPETSSTTVAEERSPDDHDRT
ncbi:DUF7322 domain-containing protein [Natrarchaeobius oligotrophus]|uniref:DUF7322 domain-containing protein n=1 Tax=Natrarchaeobius chitinivorans TaxID=1679083 RepID=A0A3N6PH11_NATCH|nr:hypothetical protein [Natrarchaeobius chitinivorans]RQG99709.1 hypothetical protein EA472_13730 [Natrarchaeobius chitinivorans]